MSKEYNSSHGIKNPNEIWPGQILTFLFEDGTWNEVIVEKGDNQWKIIRKLDKLKNEHGEIISPVKDTLVPLLPQPMPIDSSITEPFHWWWSFPWGWLLLVIAVLVIGGKLFEMLYNNRRQNPVTAGPPQVNGGVRDNEAYSRMNQVAQNRFPGSQIVIKNIRRGWLSGWAQVFYADGKTKTLKLKDVAAYAGEATINGREQTIYFLQGCGNDARGGNYMTGDDLEFRPHVIINQDGSESPLPAEAAEIAETEQVVEEQILPTTPTPVTLGSETHQQKMLILDIAKILAAREDIHELTIDGNAEALGLQAKFKFTPAEKKVSEKSGVDEKK